MFEEQSRPHKDALPHKALYKTQAQQALLHWVCKWIYMGDYWTWNFSPSPSTKLCFLLCERGMPLLLDRHQPGDKMEHGISNTAWTESKVECVGRELQPGVLHCGGGGLTGESRGEIRVYFTSNSVCDWLSGRCYRLCWLYKHAFLSSNSSASF